MVAYEAFVDCSADVEPVLREVLVEVREEI